MKIQPNMVMRMVLEKGIHSVRWCKTEDNSDDILCVSDDPVMFQSEDKHELKALIEVALRTITSPIIVLNSCTKKEYKWK